MKKYSLLEVVQEMARSINADELTSLDESIEAVDLAGLALTTLNDILGRQAWEFLSDRVIDLSSVDGFIFPLPDNVVEVLEVYASSATVSKQVVPYSMPQYFVRRAAQHTTGTVINIPTTGDLLLDPTGIPARYTSFDELNIVLINNAPTNTISMRARVTLDTSGAGNNIDGYNEAWVPTIPLRMFNYWVFECCALAHSVMRQQPDQRMEGMAQRAYEALMRHPATTRLETQQRKLSRLMDARLQAAEMQATGTQRGPGDNQQ